MIKVSQVLVFHFTTLYYYSNLLLVPAYRSVFRTWSNINNGVFFAKIFNSFKLFTIFGGKAQFKMSDWVENRLLAKRHVTRRWGEIHPGLKFYPGGNFFLRYTCLSARDENWNFPPRGEMDTLIFLHDIFSFYRKIDIVISYNWEKIRSVIIYVISYKLKKKKIAVLIDYLQVAAASTVY